MTNWILPFGLGGDGMGESPVIIYDKDNGGSWQIHDKDQWNRTISVGDHFSTNMSHQEDLWYTPDVAIEGNTISLNFFVRNLAGEDCSDADLNITTEYESLNEITGSPEGAVLSGTAARVHVRNLSAGESTEVRVITELPEPGPEKILRLRITLMAPDAFITGNGTSRTYDPDRLPRGTATFVIKAKDAPDLEPAPTFRAA